MSTWETSGTFFGEFHCHSYRIMLPNKDFTEVFYTVNVKTDSSKHSTDKSEMFLLQLWSINPKVKIINPEGQYNTSKAVEIKRSMGKNNSSRMPYIYLVIILKGRGVTTALLFHWRKINFSHFCRSWFVNANLHIQIFLESGTLLWHQGDTLGVNTPCNILLWHISCHTCGNAH